VTAVIDELEGLLRCTSTRGENRCKLANGHAGRHVADREFNGSHYSVEWYRLDDEYTALRAQLAAETEARQKAEEERDEQRENFDQWRESAEHDLATARAELEAARRERDERRAAAKALAEELADIEKLRAENLEWLAAARELLDADTDEERAAAEGRLDALRIGNGDVHMPPEVRRSLLDQLAAETEARRKAEAERDSERDKAAANYASCERLRAERDTARADLEAAWQALDVRPGEREQSLAVEIRDQLGISHNQLNAARTELERERAVFRATATMAEQHRRERDEACTELEATRLERDAMDTRRVRAESALAQSDDARQKAEAAFERAAINEGETLTALNTARAELEAARRERDYHAEGLTAPYPRWREYALHAEEQFATATERVRELEAAGERAARALERIDARTDEDPTAGFARVEAKALREVLAAPRT